MQKILILGAGNIGSLISCLLANSGHYDVYLADIHPPKITLRKPLANLSTFQLDVTATAELKRFIAQKQIQVIVSCLSYYFNVELAELARKLNLHYFDLTEDVAVFNQIKEIAKDAKNIFMPHCGLAPGFINIAANSLMQEFDVLESAELRVGDLPVNVNNALQYALSWSTDGLINEYGNTCYGIAEEEKVSLQPLDDLEEVEIDGRTYEAFNTSGGIGTLVESYLGKIKVLNYKSLRYPGHCEKMRFLMKDLKLNEDRKTLKRILENALPKTLQDVALIYIAITGIKENQLLTRTYVNKIYPQIILQQEWTAIQVTTASGLCAVLDIVLNKADDFKGLVLQEQIPLADFLENHFGKIFEVNRA